MAHRQQRKTSSERRVLVMAVPDVLDTTIALCRDRQGCHPHFLSCTGPVDGAQECTPCGGYELAAASRDVAAAYRPTHLVVRDGSGNGEDLERCRVFLEGALTAASSTITCVIQTHPRPRTPTISGYDAWLKSDSVVHGGRDLDIVWHEPLTTTFLDCRGSVQRLDDDLAWHRSIGPARTIARWLRDGAPHNLEYTVVGSA